MSFAFTVIRIGGLFPFPPGGVGPSPPSPGAGAGATFAAAGYSSNPSGISCNPSTSKSSGAAGLMFLFYGTETMSKPFSPSVAVPGLRSAATGSSATGAFPSGKSPACSEIRFSFPKAAQRSL